ncbi:MAG: LLM class flavin-dependent oxidoreductase [Dehalococcoidia bacterium]|nr:LLM class flavin-dependent oxidoreductase [Dehalococcoidia bacterium]
MSAVPLSLLDLALIGEGETPRDALEGSVAIARKAEELGYLRIWYAEHHNMATIASSAPAVLIAHVAAHTSRIRLGSGGVMLPNHAPLVIAEQFGTLASLHPGRIDLGLGRAPGTDQVTLRALRRSPQAAEHFPQDVLELQAYLSDETRVPTVNATPGRGTNVPIYVLGSSLFGARLAAVLGLPYGFASHFAPQALHDAIHLYRTEFQPSDQLAAPYVIAGVNVIAAETEDAARALLEKRRRMLVRNLFGRAGQPLSDDEVELVLASPQAAQVEAMFHYTAAGTPAAVRAYLDEFQRTTGADELMVVHHGDSVATRLRSLELLGAATPAPTPA